MECLLLTEMLYKTDVALANCDRIVSRYFASLSAKEQFEAKSYDGGDGCGNASEAGAEAVSFAGSGIMLDRFHEATWYRRTLSSPEANDNGSASLRILARSTIGADIRDTFPIQRGRTD